MKNIPLTKGKFAVVSDFDYDALSKWKWHINSTGYAVRSIWDGKKVKKILMHRQITKTPIGMETDHIDRNKLNNCRENLRICTRSQNTANTRKKGKNTYRGVVLFKNRWYGRISIDGKIRSLGGFSCPEDAALAYNFAALEHYGEFATMNKVAA